MPRQASNILSLKLNSGPSKNSLLCSVVVLCLFAFAPMASAGSWSNLVNVTDAYAHSSGNIYVQYTEMHNPDGCSSTGHVVVLASNAAGDRIYSTLLNAVATGQKVIYYVSGCNGAYPQMLHIRIKPPE